MSSTIVSRPDQASAKMPRRIYRLLDFFSTVGAFVLAIEQLLPVPCLSRLLKYGKIARNNPRQAMGLGWLTRATSLTEKFIRIPIMDHKANDYGWLANKTQYEVQTVG